MTMRYRIEHQTTYRYSVPVTHAQHLLHLIPRPMDWQRPWCCQVTISPEPTQRRISTDAWGNQVEYVAIEFLHEQLEISLVLCVEVEPRPWTIQTGRPVSWESTVRRLRYGGEIPLEVSHYLYQSPYVRVKNQLADFAREFFPRGSSLFEAVQALNQHIYQDFTYLPASTTIETPVMDILQERRGVCQDFAHLMIASLRSLGLAARYVCGYLRTDPPPGQPRLQGVDATHAWVAVYFPESGWVEWDPTNGCLADERYVVVGWGRDFGDVSPVRGVIQGGGAHELKVSVTVEPGATSKPPHGYH
ncbi:MAG: transglutaminase family protein [Pseudomonadales bacterium]|nr:transglutaminase family protein [Pseudomonadales bacterium]